MYYIFYASLVTCACLATSATAEIPTAISAEKFDKLHGMIKPQSGESRWMEIDWHPSVWEARQKAAAEGKPVFR